MKEFFKLKLGQDWRKKVEKTLWCTRPTMEKKIERPAEQLTLHEIELLAKACGVARSTMIKQIDCHESK
jgi:hypothetical protein